MRIFVDSFLLLIYRWDNLLNDGHFMQCSQTGNLRYNIRRNSKLLIYITTFFVVVVVYHVTIVAIGIGLLKKFWPFGTCGRILSY